MCGMGRDITSMGKAIEEADVAAWVRQRYSPYLVGVRMNPLDRGAGLTD